MPLLSVVIATHDRSALLADALASVRAQEFTDYELIVVDDGSTDDTPAVLAQFGEGEPPDRFRVLRQANAGPGAARNRGIAEARGEYCTFLDSDDLQFPWSLAIIAEAIIRHDRPPVLLGRELRFAKAEEFAAAMREPLRATAWPDLYVYAVQNHLGVTGTLIARTALLREVGGFSTEPMVGDGADVMLRLGVIPTLVKIDSPATYGYRVRAEHSNSQERWVRRAGELIRRFRSGALPNPPARTAELRKLLARDAAYFSIVCLFLGGRRNCLKLYLNTIGFQLRGGNFSYLLKTPLLLALSSMGLWPKRRNAAL